MAGSRVEPTRRDAAFIRVTNPEVRGMYGEAGRAVDSALQNIP